MRVPLLRTAYRVAYHLIGLDAVVRRPRGRGVKCVLAHGESVVLVRHTYGPRRTWHIPGGGLKRGETTIDAARREMHEELGLEGVAFESLGRLQFRLQHRPVTIGCVYAQLSDTTLRADPVEIAEARFFSRGALPTPLGEEVRSLVAFAFEAVAARERAMEE